jgi:hypothetical protein
MHRHVRDRFWGAHSWTLHLPCASGTETDLYRRAQMHGFVLTDVVWGDSWAVWGEEPSSPDEPTALHIYFTAPDEREALSQAQWIVQDLMTNNCLNYAVSAAADWAEIVPNWATEFAATLDPQGWVVVPNPRARLTVTTLNGYQITEFAPGNFRVYRDHDWLADCAGLDTVRRILRPLE